MKMPIVTVTRVTVGFNQSRYAFYVNNHVIYCQMQFVHAKPNSIIQLSPTIHQNV